MEALFTAQYQWLWTVVLGAALFLPVRSLIWTMQIRRAQKKTGEDIDQAETLRLKNRAGVTAGLLCFVFAVVYVNQLFSGTP